METAQEAIGLFDGAEDEAQEKAKAAANSEKIEPTGPFEYQCVSDIKLSFEIFDFVQGLLTYSALSVVYGASNVGKTFFALDVAYHVAVGQKWFGKQVDQGSVIYFSLEGARGIDQRLVPLRDQKFSDIEGPHQLYKIVERAKFWDSPVDTARLIETVNAIGNVRMVVIDTLSRAMAGGDENSSQDMSATVDTFCKVIEATGAHVMLVHHSGKAVAQGARGHSSLRAAVDTEIELTLENKGMENEIVLAKVTKQRDLPSGGEFRFKRVVHELGLNPRGETITSCTIEQVESPDRVRQLSKEESNIQRLKDAFIGRKTISTTKQLRELSCLNGINFSAAKKKLIDRGELDMKRKPDGSPLEPIEWVLLGGTNNHEKT